MVQTRRTEREGRVGEKKEQDMQCQRWIKGFDKSVEILGRAQITAARRRERKRDR